VIRVTVRSLLRRPLRAVLTALAAVVGIGVVTGTLIVSDTAARLGTSDPELDLVRQVMLLAGGVALLVGAFIVNITMSVTVAQRTAGRSGTRSGSRRWASARWRRSAA
jgi:uncharacterized membrane protein